MGWLNRLGELLQRHAGGSQAEGAGADYEEFARQAPREEKIYGAAHAFRSSETPPFPQMVAQMFGSADDERRADLLNGLIGAVGPAIAARMLDGLGERPVAPSEAAQVTPGSVEYLASAAEQSDPGVVDRISEIVADNPGLFSALGGGVFGSVLEALARRHGGRGPESASGDPYGDPADRADGQQVFDAAQDPYGDPADRVDGRQVFDAAQDPYGDPADRVDGQQVFDAAQDPYGDPADRVDGQQVFDAAQDPYGDPADEEERGFPVEPASRDPFGDPADRR